MRFLSFHTDYFWYKVTKRGRSKVFEELSDFLQESRVENAVIFLTNDGEYTGKATFVDSSTYEETIDDKLCLGVKIKLNMTNPEN